MRGLVVFAEVVEAKSFARAATRLGMTRSAVSKHVAQLEAQLGVSLLSRTTRKLSLTEVGTRVYEASVRVRDGAELAREAAQVHTGVVEGTLRVTAPVSLGRLYLVPLVRELLALHPRLEVALVLRDDFVDLVEERIDVALRVGRFADSSLIAVRLAKVSFLHCAAPAYLEAHGTPRSPADLDEHEWVQHLPSADPGLRVFEKGKRTVEVRVHGRIGANDGHTEVEAAVHGLGIVSAPDFVVSHEIKAGRLVPVLCAYSTANVLYAVSPPRRHVSSKVRSFIDFVRERWREPPWRIPGAPPWKDGGSDGREGGGRLRGRSI